MAWMIQPIHEQVTIRINKEHTDRSDQLAASSQSHHHCEVSSMKLALTWSSVGSLLATAVVVRSTVRDVLPPEAHDLLRAVLWRVTAAFVQPPDTIVIHETDGNGVPNELYESAQLYLGSRCLAVAPALHLHKAHGAPSSVASLPESHTTSDTFQGVCVTWTSRGDGSAGTYYSYGGRHRGYAPPGCERRSLVLQFRRRDRAAVRDAYIPHVLDEAAKLRRKTRQRKLYTNGGNFGRYGGGSADDDHQMLWSSHSFAHPSTFDTLAIDPALRDGIREDLLRFVGRREHYARAGRAWKRGYLLHGPPGTGKTSLIAAIANLLEFDIYDLELTTVGTNTDLRRLLASTRPKSIIVIEDIDCSLGLFDRTKRPMGADGDNAIAEPNTGVVLPRAPGMVFASMEPDMRRDNISLSGVLNFVDGLWSSCVGERLIVFTTNHVDRLDPALLRPGRMDRRIELGYCNAAALRVLANNYLSDCGVGEDDHDYKGLMREAEALLEEVNVTAAVVAEVFMGCDGDGAHAAMQKLVDDLNSEKNNVEVRANV